MIINCEVIALFSAEGVPQPFRLRITTEDGSLLVIPIKRILFMDKNLRNDILKYRCECVIQDRLRCVDLYYDKMNIKWSLDLKQGM